tara:strand:+ start:143 stop:748 length:606 start_codon:yes stop_codon:yes gene_type:complete
MPKLYTKTGDMGTTSLYDGNIIPKSSIFFKTLGSLDELNSHIGLMCGILKDRRGENSVPEIFRSIQVRLIDIGSNLAIVEEGVKKNVTKITNEDVKELEEMIDIFDGKNSKLTVFILPGLYTEDGQCHVCRSTCRRFERDLWELNDAEGYFIKGSKQTIRLDTIKVDPVIMKYINRLSDLFFAYSRNLTGCQDIKITDIKN